MKGLSECKASKGNIRRIRVKDIVKKVEDYLKTYSSAGMDISYVVDENLPQLLDSRGGSHVTNVPAFDKEDFMSWKVRFLVFLDGLEPYLLKTLENGLFMPMSSLSTSENPLPKRQNQWSNAESRLANQDKRLKSIIISCLPNYVMKSVIKCKTAKETWNDLILAYKRPSDIRDTMISALRLIFNAFKSLEGEKVNGTFTRLPCWLNDFETNGVTIPQAEVNATFVNSLPRKWLIMNQTQRENNSIKNDSLATLYGKYKYKEGLIAQIYKSKTQRFTIQASSSKALISNNQFHDSDSDVEEDQRTNNEFMDDLNAEYHERVLLVNQKRFYKRSGRMMKRAPRSRHLWQLQRMSPQLEKLMQDQANGKYPYISQDCLTLKTLYLLIALFKMKSLGENESLKDEIVNLKKVIEKWTYTKVTLDQLLSEQVPGNIVKALGRKDRRKEKISSKEVVITKADESSSKLAPEITYVLGI
ncbi:hypothetical protein Tco_0454386 [Tanacetum coccineum]